MQEGRRYRVDEVFVKDWATFLKVQKSYDFIKTLGELSPEQCRSQIKKNLIELTQDQKSQCIVFPNSLKPQYLSIMIELVQSQEFKMLLDYEHEGLFLGNAKQLVIFKKRASVASYLSKYRPTKKYQTLFAEAMELSREYQMLVAGRNIKISEQVSEQQIETKTKQISAFKQKKLDPKVSAWRKQVCLMVQDFQKQPKKQQILFLGINSLLTQQLKQITNNYELYLSNRYQKISIHDEYRDVSLTKYDRSESSQSFDDRSGEDDDQVFLEEKDGEGNDGKEQKEQEREIVVQVPKNIDNVVFRGFGEYGANCVVTILTFGKLNPVDYLQVNLISPKDTEHQKKYQQKIPISPGQYEYEIILNCLHTGVSTFEIKAVNSVGSCKVPYIFKIWMDGLEGSANQQGVMKINSQNSVLHVLGESSQGVIPNWDPESKDIIGSTQEKWEALKFLCADFSVSSHGTICNRQGDVASWGKMYYFDEEGANQDQSSSDTEEEDELGLGKLESANFRIEKPSCILESAFIRKVSCGEGYCLMADSLGRAWSFGLNTFGQLGLEHTNQSIDTSEPTMIRYFSYENIFVTDVVASYFGGSFAIDDKGQAYRWGTNQIDHSNRPIKDNFNSITNFQYPDIIAAQSLPIPLTKTQISQKILSIHPGFNFVLALSSSHKLYGWGRCRYLGLGEINDAHFKSIENLCNPILLQEGVRKVKVGWNHCLALKGDDLVAWGEAKFYREDEKGEFVGRPEIMRKEFKGVFACGPDFTVYGEGDKSIAVIGNKKVFKTGKYQLPCPPLKLEAGQGIIMVLGNIKEEPQQPQ